MMRLVYLLVFLAGAGLAFGYPWAARNLSGQEVGAWRAFDMAAGFLPIDATLKASDAPVKVVLDVSAIGDTDGAGESVLTLTVSGGGKTVLAKTLDFQNAVATDDSPQTPQQSWRIEAGELTEVTDGTYRFVVGPGDAEGVQLLSADMKLLGGAGGYDERALPVGISIMALGFIVFVLSFRGSGGANSNSQPPAPRWGRGPG